MLKDFPVQIVYLHGFNSGYDTKNQKIKDLSAIVNTVVGYTVNYLQQDEVKKLEDLIITCVDSYPGETILVGTSLGGYFARYFSNKFNLRTILINPAVDPEVSLMKAVGVVTNYNTNEKYEVTKGAVEKLADYNVLTTQDALMILATDDDVIPYEKPLIRYGDTCKTVLTTGGHRMDDLNKVNSEITAFINRLPSSDNTIL